ncbi:AMP-binding protein [Oceanibacterium hippocampi]|uniref:Long-chain-fatty-acid--CoA ligase n=1 Tax=Oceanibacterium hippocampi TaxID=745714 RepID=A0A1Y5TAR1_9PROT|nr:AMP-binding protein [Oceanibacterium hippocampi]SLN56146.1 Long-chain-fatty-acid--CoA ligase [Oceanibacterium hippocampi]
MTTLPAFGDRAARLHRDRLAIVDGDLRWSHRDLVLESRRLAAGLAAAGIGPGDRVAFWLPNSAAYLALFFAVARLGAVAVSVNTRFRAADVGDILGRSRAKALIFWPGFRGIAFDEILAAVPAADLAALETVILYGPELGNAALPGALGAVRVTSYGSLREFDAALFDHATADAGCVTFTTSGTTAAPKFVLHSQASIARHAEDVARHFGFHEDRTVLLQSLPFCGTFGLAQAMSCLAGGGVLVNMPVFDVERAVELMDRFEVTDLNATDDMTAALLDAAHEWSLARLRQIGYAAFNPALREIVTLGDMKGVPLVGLWGMSEVQALYSVQRREAPAAMRARAGGYPASPGARVRVVDPETRAILPHGREGEIEAAGPSRMLGYVDDPAATARALTDDGYVRTGDLGYTEADGGFVFLTRLGDSLRLGGFLVSPAEIEAHLERHPAVAGAQVVGVETGQGARAVAFVVPRAGAGFDDGMLREHCIAGLARYKVPMAFVALDSFPMTDSPNGRKVQRVKLREIAAERFG